MKKRRLRLVSRLLVYGIIAFAAIIYWKRKTTEALEDVRYKGQQLLVVTTDDWTSTSGTLSLYQRRSTRHWVQYHSAIPVTVGCNGLAWGPGLHDITFNQPPLKQEGDGKSPAGIFPLESLFSYEDLTAGLPSLKVTTNTFCVDDPKSKYYNQIVSGEELKPDWSSAETMRMTTDHYKYGIVVGYNTPESGGVKPGFGSCIFIHIGEPDGTTAGCTAMAEEDLKTIINWLSKKPAEPLAKPLIVQAPAEVYPLLATKHNLPQLK